MSNEHPQKNEPHQQKRELDPQEGEMDGNIFKKPFEAVFGASEADEERSDTDLQDRAGENVDKNEEKDKD